MEFTWSCLNTGGWLMLGKSLILMSPCPGVPCLSHSINIPNNSAPLSSLLTVNWVCLMWQEAYAVPQTNIWAEGSCEREQCGESISISTITGGDWRLCWDESEMSDKRSWPSSSPLTLNYESLDILLALHTTSKSLKQGIYENISGLGSSLKAWRGSVTRVLKCSTLTSSYQRSLIDTTIQPGSLIASSFLPSLPSPPIWRVLEALITTTLIILIKILL